MSGASTTPAVLLDTNLIVSGAITPHGVPNRILQAYQRGAFTLVSAPEMVGEVEDVLYRPKIVERYRPHPAIVRSLLDGPRAALARSLPLVALPIRCRDPKDDFLLACALDGRADCLVTGDADLLGLDGHPALGSLHIVTPRDLLALIEGAEPT